MGQPIPGNSAHRQEVKMYGVFKGSYCGEMVWIGTLDNVNEAVDLANETMLKDEETVMVMEVFGFRQQL